jgi:ActR/RegA family two-component response regulator
MRILLMEDEDAIRSALTRGLSARGHDVQAAACLADARALVTHFAPEALVSDLKLPDGNGLDLAEELKIPFVLMTGYGTFDDAVRAMRLGCLDFFTKPAPIKDICRALEKVSSRSSSGPLVMAMDASGVRLARVRGGAVADSELRHRTVTWNDAAQARERFNELADLLPNLTTRQIAAELLQTADHGTLAVNLLDDGWSAWLQAPVTWDTHRDCQQVIEPLARACTWIPSGAVVECAHGG